MRTFTNFLAEESKSGLLTCLVRNGESSEPPLIGDKGGPSDMLSLLWLLTYGAPPRWPMDENSESVEKNSVTRYRADGARQQDCIVINFVGSHSCRVIHF
jgi:hypothetical protein